MRTRAIFLATLAAVLLESSPGFAARASTSTARRYTIADLERADRSEKRAFWRRAERALLVVGTLGLALWLPGSTFAFRSDTVSATIRNRD